MTGGESEANTQLPPPAGAVAESAPRPSRRAFLAGGGLAALAGAGAGVGIEYWRDSPAPAPAQRRHAPAALVAALAAEHNLIAALDAALPGAGTHGALLRQVRADHAAHARAVAAAVTDAGGAPTAPSAAHAPTGTASAPSEPADVAVLRSAESAAALGAAKRAGALSGRDAALLASIAACEASHAELLA